MGGSPKDKITYNKGTLTYPSRVIATKSLLVVGRPHQGSVLLLFKHVDVHLALFLFSLLIIEVDAWSVKIEVGRDDRLKPIDEEEGGVSYRAVHARPQAPK